MGNKLVKGCCETKNSSSYLNLRSDSLQIFEYQDDDPITVTPLPHVAAVCKLKLEFPVNYVHLGSTSPYEVPVCLSFETVPSAVRPGTDLLVVVDLSRYSVLWLEEIKNTLLNILKELTPNDRMSIVGFNTKVFKLSNLVAGTYEGVLKLTRIINELTAEDDADIVQGLSTSLLVLKNRLFINSNTSVLFFSSAPDTYNETVLERAETLPSDLKDHSAWISIVALGSSHNAELLNFLSISGSYTYLPFPSSTSPVLDSLFKKKLQNLSISLSVSSILQVEISKIFHHTKSLECGKGVVVVFIMTIKQAFDDVKDRVCVHAKVSHKFDSAETSASVDVYGKTWVLEEVIVDEMVMVCYFKEKAIEALLMTINKDFVALSRIVDLIMNEVIYSSNANSRIFKGFIGRLEALRNELSPDQGEESRNKALVYAFIRNHWGRTASELAF